MRADITFSEEPPNYMVDFDPRRTVETVHGDDVQPGVHANSDELKEENRNGLGSGDTITGASPTVHDNRVVSMLETALAYEKEDDVISASPPRSGWDGDSKGNNVQAYRSAPQDVHSLDSESAGSAASRDFEQLIADTNNVKGMLAGCLDLNRNPRLR